MLLSKLKAISSEYKSTKLEFNFLSEDIIKSYNLSKGQKKYVSFGIIEAENPYFQRSLDDINRNEKLQFLSNKMKQLKLKGNCLLLELALMHNVSLLGYNLKSLLSNRNKNVNEINDVILGMNGYEHIHIINNKVMFELPVRQYVLSHDKLLKCVDYWINELNETL